MISVLAFLTILVSGASSFWFNDSVVNSITLNSLSVHVFYLNSSIYESLEVECKESEEVIEEAMEEAMEEAIEETMEEAMEDEESEESDESDTSEEAIDDEESEEAIEGEIASEI